MSNRSLSTRETWAYVEEAITCCDEELRLNPKSYTAYVYHFYTLFLTIHNRNYAKAVNLWMYMEDKEKRKQALECYKKCIELGPNDDMEVTVCIFAV